VTLHQRSRDLRRSRLLELRDGTINDVTFIDSCWGYTVDLIGVDHVTGDAICVPFSEVSEIVFP